MIWAKKAQKEMEAVTWNCVPSKLCQLQISKELFPVFLMLSLTQKFSSLVFANTVLVCDCFFSLHDTSLGWTQLTLNFWAHALNKLPNRCYLHKGNTGWSVAVLLPILAVLSFFWQFMSQPYPTPFYLLPYILPTHTLDRVSEFHCKISCP